MKTVIIKARLRALVADQLRRCAEFMEHRHPGEQAYMCVKSGSNTSRQVIYKLRRAGVPIDDIPSTTSAEKIKEAYCKAMNSGAARLLIFTTYDSAARIREAGITSDLEINDEAHNLCTKGYIEADVFCVGGGDVLSMTATPEECKDLKYSMRNPKFGNWIARDSATAIENGRIAMPFLHFMPRDEMSSHNAHISAILDGFEAHKKALKERSFKPDDIGAKLLVAMPSIADVQAARNNFEIRELSRSGVVVIAIDSENGAWIDGVAYPPSRAKEQVLSKIWSLEPTDEAIVIQIAMLTEGIDVAGFTGSLLLRGFSERNLVQFAGRSLRLCPEDRERIDTNKIPRAMKFCSSESHHKRVKPYGHIIIPIFEMADIRNTSLVSLLVRRFRDEFGFIPTEEQILIDVFGAPGEIERRIRDEVKAVWHHILEDEINDISAIWAYKLASEYPACAQDVFEILGLKHKSEDLQTAVEASGYDLSNVNKMVRGLRNSGQGVFADSVKKQFGTIYTPDHVIEATIDLAFKHLDKSLDRTILKYCDPAAGDGNFLEILYGRLMEDEQFIAKWPDPISRSRNIITKNIWGFEILKAMHTACQIRLVMLHLEITKTHNAAALAMETEGLVDELNVYWGNTIKTPEDPAVWEWTDKKNIKHISPNEKVGEGDVLPQELREMKFGMIVGNPPYTHLRNMDNRKYTAYPKQRDLAQVFVRWALDHLIEKGVVSLNTIDTWLNVKVNDGALETREMLSGRLREAIASDEIRTYSEDQNGVGGGEVPTFVLCFSASIGSLKFIVDEQLYQYDLELLNQPGFLQRLKNINIKFEFINAAITAYIGVLKGARSGNRHGSKTDIWRSFLYKEYAGSRFYLVGKSGMYEHTYAGNWKLIRAGEGIKKQLQSDLESEIKYAVVSYEHGLWLIGYLNTNNAKKYVSTYCKLGANHGGWLAILAAGTIKACQVPDFDWYKTNKPQEHAAFLKWVEDNMRDKDAFLAGVDAEFEKLIAK